MSNTEEAPKFEDEYTIRLQFGSIIFDFVKKASSLEAKVTLTFSNGYEVPFYIDLKK